MRIPLILGIAGAAALSATPAFAQDAPAKAPFSGAYIGAAAGYDVQHNDVGSNIQFDRNLDGRFGDTVTNANGANAFAPGFCNGGARGVDRTNTCRNDKDNFSYYVRAGIDRQYGAIVVGAVGEFGKTEIIDRVAAFSSTPASYTMTRKVRWESSLRARAGFAAQNTLFYATGGAGFADIGHSFNTTNTLNSFTGRGKQHEFGYLAGGGLEQKVSEHISLGLEYMFHSYKDDDYRVRVGQGSAPATNPFVLAPNTTGTDLARSDKEFRWHSIRAVAAYRF